MKVSMEENGRGGGSRKRETFRQDGSGIVGRLRDRMDDASGSGQNYAG